MTGSIPAWYESWFNQQYLELYSHRDDSQALDQVKALSKALRLKPDTKILDIGCGSGRHLKAFHQLGYSPVGMDLSPHLLDLAKEISPKVFRGNMLFPPIKKSKFDLIAFFFSSFGYFESELEDFKCLESWSGRLAKRGFLFLDLSNPQHVKTNLVEMERTERNGTVVVQRRFLQGDLVVKKISFERAGTVERFEERLRLYSNRKICGILENLNFKILDIWGDEKAASYIHQTSSRMSILAQKK